MARTDTKTDDGRGLVNKLKAQVQNEIANRITNIADPSDERVKALIKEVVGELSATTQYETVTQGDVNAITRAFTDDFLGFGPLQPLLADTTISEIMVNGGGFDEDGLQLPHEVWIERDGRLVKTDVRFDDEDHVVRIMNRIVGRSGRHLDQANPIEDASLPDGSRFNGTLYPTACDGSCFNIRKFQQSRLGFREMVTMGTMTRAECEFLAACVMSRCSILISGGTGSGKTTMLNMLSGFIPDDERIITIEDTCELLVRQEHGHVVRFESRKPNSEGKGGVTLNDLLVATLRKRPDRIIVGECRGPEAYTMLEAMNTGHDGSLTTIHANDAQAALTRLVTLVKQGDATLSEETVRAKIADAIDLVVQVQRKSDGTRKITEIMAVGNYQEGVIQHDRLFEFAQEGTDARGHVIGHHHGCGTQPKRIKEKIQEAGYAYNLDWMTSGE